MGSAWLGGIIAGFLAVAFSSLLIMFFFVPPLFSMSVAQQSQTYFAAFVFCAIAITLVSSAMKRSEAAIRESRDLLEVKVQVSIKLVLAQDLPKVELDPIQIQQVLLNLVTTGMDAMEAISGPHQMTIRSGKQSESEIRVTVEDRGPGLTPQTVARMFEPFFSTKPQGTGMGLAICRSIIESHDGRIWAVESTGSGATFTSLLGCNHDGSSGLI